MEEACEVAAVSLIITDRPESELALTVKDINHHRASSATEEPAEPIQLLSLASQAEQAYDKSLYYLENSEGPQVSTHTHFLYTSH